MVGALTSLSGKRGYGGDDHCGPHHDLPTSATLTAHPVKEGKPRRRQRLAARLRSHDRGRAAVGHFSNPEIGDVRSSRSLILLKWESLTEGFREAPQENA